MHFSRQSVLEEHGVPIIVKGEGHHIFDSKGKKYIDGLSGLFVVNAGHGRRRLAEVAAKQAEELAFFPIWSYAHPAAIELADRLADGAPGDLNRVFFSTGGGEAVETAFKLAKYYWKLQGRPTKHKVHLPRHRLPRHAAGRPRDHRHPGPEGDVRAGHPRWIPGAEHELLPRPGDGLRRVSDRLRPRQKEFGLWAANRIEEMILFEGPETVAAIFLEPVQNSGGCFPPPPGYFQRVREICDQYDVLLVSDEVICAFGRIGHMFACETYGYQPDMITCAKGMTSGYSPIGATIISDRIYEPFRHGNTAFYHGYTFGGHPVSAAVALENLAIFEEEKLNEHVRENSPIFRVDARAPQGSAHRRRRARRRILLRHRAGQGQGRPRRRSTTTSPSACFAASFRRRSSRPACTAAPTTGATPSCSWLPR